MAPGFLQVRVHLDYDSSSWMMEVQGGSTAPRTLAATTVEAAQTEAAGLLTGMTLVSPWEYGGDPEAGSRAVFSQPGSGNATKASLLALWTAHKAMLLKLGVDVAALPAGQRALLFSQDVMLTGVLKMLIDKELITTEDVKAACGAVGAADFSWLPGV